MDTQYFAMSWLYFRHGEYKKALREIIWGMEMTNGGQNEWDKINEEHQRRKSATYTAVSGGDKPPSRMR